MIKFVVLLTSAITFNFTLSFGEILGLTNENTIQEINLSFTEEPIGFESGQPVYPISTKVYVTSSIEKEFTISVNGGKEFTKNGSEIDISNFIKPHADTYTVLVEAKANEETAHKIFGFSTR